MTQYGPRFTANASWVRTTYPDKGEHRPGRGFESVVCPLEGTQIESLACHASLGGISCGVATWASGGGPYNMYFTHVILLLGSNVGRYPKNEEQVKEQPFP